MSKERAQRRAAREAELAAGAEKREQAVRAAQAREARRVSRRRRAASLRRSGRGLGLGGARPSGALAQRRRRRAGSVLAAFVVVEGAVWLLRDSWWEWGLAAVVGLLLLPVVLAVVTGRR